MIEIWLDERQPPSGRVVASPGEQPMPFDGWLQLLHILGTVISQGPPSGPAPATP